MIHIVFQEPDVTVLQQAIQLDPLLSGDVLLIKDDYAVGPIADLQADEGRERRKQWWRELLAGGDLDGSVDSGTVNDDATFEDIITRLQDDADEQLWIWAAQNKHDVSGYYWLVSRLKPFQGRVYILYLNNLPFFNEKGSIFYPDRLATIPPREFLKAKKLARPITLSEFEIDPDEWKKLGEQDKPVRLLEGGKKLVQRDINFYDDELQQYVSADWQKVSRILHQFLGKARQTTGDAFLLWRLKQLVAEGKLEAQGELKGMKDFELKRKTI